MGALAAAAACGAPAGDVDPNANVGATPGDSAALATAAADAGPGTVLFVGTSLTAGLGLEPEEAYPALVGLKIDSAGLPYRVVNAGVSGETTAALVRRLDWLLEAPFDVIVVESGANDGLRGVPVATARENLDTVLARVRGARPEAAIVLAAMEAPPNLGAAYTDAFRAMYRALAERHGATLLPFLLDSVAGVARYNQPDGIHPNEAGERIVARNVWRGLEPVLRARAGSLAPAAGPD